MEMSVADAAKFFNVSERTIFRRLKVGSLHKNPDSEQLLVLIDTDTDDIEVTGGHDSDSGVSDSVSDDVSGDFRIQLKELEMENQKLEEMLKMKEEQISFFKAEAQRLQFALTFALNRNRGFLSRLKSLIFPKALPTDSEIQLEM
jgi:hypothetical protein